MFDILIALRFKIFVAFILGLIITVTIAAWSDFAKLQSLLISFKWEFLFYALLFFVATYTGRFLKWQLYMYSLKVDIGIRNSLRIFISGLALSVTPGRAGEVLKAYLLKTQFNIDFAVIAPTVIAERLSGLAGAVLAFAFSVYLIGRENPYTYRILALTMVLIGTALSLIQNRSLAELCLEKLSYFNWLREKIPWVRKMHNSIYILTRNRIFLYCIVISSIYWTAESALLACVLTGLDVKLEFPIVMFILTLSSIVGGISLMPGSLGVLEAGMIGLLQLEGLDFTTASAAALLHRFISLWLAVFIGIVCLLWNRKVFNLLPRGQEAGIRALS